MTVSEQSWQQEVPCTEGQTARMRTSFRTRMQGLAYLKALRPVAVRAQLGQEHPSTALATAIRAWCHLSTVRTRQLRKRLSMTGLACLGQVSYLIVPSRATCCGILT